MNALDELRTDRLRLTRICADDLPDLTRMYADPQVTVTLGGLLTAQQTADYLDVQIAHWREHGFGMWTLRDGLTDQFAGRGGLRRCVVEGVPEVEISYAFLPPFWGRGLATELARECVRIGFE